MKGLFDRLLEAPRQFRFDAAVRVLMHERHRGEPGEAARFRSPAGMAYPAAEVVSVVPRAGGAAPDVTVGLSGLTGPSGVLPRLYTEQVVQQSRMGARGLHVFLDLIAQRMVAALASAGIKYRPHRSAEAAALGDRPDPHREVLLSLVGEATHASARPREEQDVLLHYAGLFAAWPRSADRLGALLSDWMGRPVTVEQFAGAWLELAPAERTRLPRGRGAGAFTRLGADATVGVRAWDAEARVVLRLGPLSAAEFDAMLPDRPSAARFAALARSFLGPAASFAVNPVLSRAAVPACVAGKARVPGEGARLGWNTWLPASRPRGEAAEAVFDARRIELQRVQRSR